MTPDDIAESYDQIADIWNREDFPRDNGIRQHERAIAFVTARGPALDIGCGCSGRIIDLLASHGFSVEGVDVSGRMIQLARQRHPDVIFHHADIVRWTFPGRYHSSNTQRSKRLAAGRLLLTIRRRTSASERTRTSCMPPAV